MPIAAGWLCLLIGLADIIEVVRPGLIYSSHLTRLHSFVPGTLVNVTHTVSVIIGLLLLMLSHGLKRRKRRAWQAVTVLLAVSAVVHVIPFREGRIVTAVVSALLVAALIYFRAEFYAVGDPRTRWRALWVFLGLVVADVAIGLTYILLARGLAQDYSLWQRVVHVVYGLVGVSGPVHFVPERRSDLFALLTSALGLFTLVVTAYLFFRPARPAGRLGQQDAERVRDLLKKQGDRDSLGYFTLRSDKSIIWSPTGKSCIGYRVVSGVMLAGGDPLGDPEAWPGAIHAFLDEAARHAWVPAVMGCGEHAAEVWCREGELTALELGDEAIVEVADFSLKGRAMRNVRQMVARVERSGYVAEVRRAGDVGCEQIGEFARQAGSWRGNPTERGFSMALGRLGAAGRRELRDRHRHRERGPARHPALRAVGRGRALAGPDAPGPLRPARRQRLPHRGDHQGRRVAGDQAHLAELRRVPVRARARRADRRRAGAPALARDPAVRLPLVPDRVAVQVQRQVRPGLGAPLLRLPRRVGRAPGRPRRPGGRGLPGLAEAGDCAGWRRRLGLGKVRRRLAALNASRPPT